MRYNKTIPGIYSIFSFGFVFFTLDWFNDLTLIGIDRIFAMTSVSLSVYDLSHGLAKAVAPMFLGTNLDGIWHTGICV